MNTTRVLASSAAWLLLLSPTTATGQTAAPPAAPAQLPPSVPPVTDEDRRAAFPDVDGHSARDNAINYFVLFDQLEWQIGHGPSSLSWDTKGWIGGDLDRLWFRTEGTPEK